MVIEVQFNEEFWGDMLKKLTAFYMDHMIPELLTRKLFQALSS